MLRVFPAQGKLCSSMWRNPRVWRDSCVILSNQNQYTENCSNLI